MSKHIIVLSMLFVFCCAFSGIQAANIPQMINYQGQLSDSSGNALDTTIQIVFRIYDDSTGGTADWTETHSSVIAVGGLFNALLGSVTALPDTIFNDTARWLGVTVGGDSELSPRTKVNSMPFSYRIKTVDGATGGSIDGDLDISGSVTIGPNSFNTGDYSTIAGGGGASAIDSNSISGDYSFIGNGQRNRIEGDLSVIVGGIRCKVDNDYNFIGGGDSNLVIQDAFKSTICGGQENVITDSLSFIGGGYYNRVFTSYSTVCGGYQNFAASGSGHYATIGGGIGNRANGLHSTIPGGWSNTAGSINSFAAGTRAIAQNEGAVVISANSTTILADTITSGANEQFVMRADGLFYLTNISEQAPYVSTKFINTSTGAFLSTGGTWTNSSDRNLKENFKQVDASDILKKVAELNITEWNYKAEDDFIKHIGPVSQDFYSLFGYGYDDKSISSIDPSSIALAAIKELYKTSINKDQEINQMKAEIEQLTALVQALLNSKSNNRHGNNANGN